MLTVLHRARQKDYSECQSIVYLPAVTRTGGSCSLTWCTGQNKDPVHCSVPTIIKILAVPPGRWPVLHSTLRVYVAAISSQHDRVNKNTVGNNRLMSLFLKRGYEAASPKRPEGSCRGPAPGVGRSMLASL